MSFKIYYSRSAGVDDSKVNPLLQTIVENIPVKRGDIALTKHTANTEYNPGLVTAANLVVVATKLSYNVHEQFSFGKGCLTEIEKALANNIPVVGIIQGEDGNHFLHTISEHNTGIDDEGTWHIGHASTNVYAELESTNDHSDFYNLLDPRENDDAEENRTKTYNELIEQECFEFGADITNREQLNSLFKIMYHNSPLWSPTGPAIMRHPLQLAFGMEAGNKILLRRRKK